jgi:hypothetical protein
MLEIPDANRVLDPGLPGRNGNRRLTASDFDPPTQPLGTLESPAPRLRKRYQA